jgi:hypothetical protein
MCFKINDVSENKVKGSLPCITYIKEKIKSEGITIISTGH